MKESGIYLHFNNSIIPNFSTMPVKSFTHFSISQKTIMYCIVETSTTTFIIHNDAKKSMDVRNDKFTHRLAYPKSYLV